MTVKIRLTSDDAGELDAAEAAIRTALPISAVPARDYPSRRAGDPTRRRYLETTGPHLTAPVSTGEAGR